MKYNACVLVLLTALVGCTKPSSTNGGSDGEDSDVNASGNRGNVSNGKGQALADAYAKCLADADWVAFRDLHWSGGKETVETLEKSFAPLVEKIGKPTETEFKKHNKYDGTTFEKYIDEEEIPGPKDILRGEIEFAVKSDQPGKPMLHVWAFVCEEDGQLKIFDYLEVWME